MDEHKNNWGYLILCVCVQLEEGGYPAIKSATEAITSIETKMVNEAKSRLLLWTSRKQVFMTLEAPFMALKKGSKYTYF